MTRPERLRMKRKAAQAINDIERSLTNVQWLHSEFKPVHPEYADLLEAIAQALFMSRDLMKSFWSHAWGPPPDDFDSYRQ